MYRISINTHEQQAANYTDVLVAGFRMDILQIDGDRAGDVIPDIKRALKRLGTKKVSGPLDAGAVAAVVEILTELLAACEATPDGTVRVGVG